MNSKNVFIITSNGKRKKLVYRLNPIFFSAETSTNEYSITFLCAFKLRISDDFEQLIFVPQMPKRSDMRLVILQTDVNWNGKQILPFKCNRQFNFCRLVLSFLTKYFTPKRWKVWTNGDFSVVLRHEICIQKEILCKYFSLATVYALIVGGEFDGFVVRKHKLSNKTTNYYAFS